MNIRADKITFGYNTHHPVLRNVTLEVPPGKVTALFGPNGCGKSTLLRCMNGSLRPQAGHVTLEGRRVDVMSAREVAQSVAVVPQETPLDVPFTASQMVMLGRYAHWDRWGQETDEDRAAVRVALDRVSACDLAGRLFSQLSGGERQRIIIARALAQQGRVLLLDEPASHLDIAHQLELYRLVHALAQEGHAVLMVCHDILVAPMFVDSAVLMKAGSVVAAGSVPAVLTAKHLEFAFGADISIDWHEQTAVHATFRASSIDYAARR